MFFEHHIRINYKEFTNIIPVPVRKGLVTIYLDINPSPLQRLTQPLFLPFSGNCTDQAAPSVAFPGFPERLTGGFDGAMWL